MKKAALVHNPTAGNGEHNKKALLELTEPLDYEVTYFSTAHSNWQDFEKEEPAIIFVAGGDGTVQKLVQAMLRSGNEALHKVPVQILPFGTANNIAHTLGISDSIESSQVDKQRSLKDYDIGRISGFEEFDFFVEGMGFGIFPKLIKQMEEDEVEVEDPEKELQVIIMNLIAIVREFEAKVTEITIDGQKINGKFLLVELLNIKYIGPQFYLAPEADPGDGKFDLVVIPEENRALLVQYLQDLLKGKKNETSLRSLSRTYRGKTAVMKWHGSEVHIDDDLVENYKSQEVQVKVDPGKLSFLVEE